MNGFYKNFIADIIIAAVLISIGVVMLPPIGIADTVLDIFVCLALVAYLVLFRLDRLRKSKGAAFILVTVEFCLVSLIAIGLILKQFQVIRIAGVCSTVGVILWLRGVIDVVSHYLSVTAPKRSKRNLAQLITDLVIISLGMLMICRQIVSDLWLNWIICVVFFIVGLVFIGLALLFHPGKAKAKKSYKAVSQSK